MMTLAALAGAGEALPVVEVKGARAEQRRQATVATTVVAHEELVRYGDATIADALKRLPGVSVDGEIRMRAMGNGYTQVLLDGAPVPKGFSIETIAPELVERVEILRAASAELGSQAIAGTINIILRKKAPARELKVAWASNGGKTVSGAFWTINDARNNTVTTTQESGPGVLRQIVRSDENRNRNINLAPRTEWQLEEAKLALAGFARYAEVGVPVHEVASGTATRFPVNWSYHHIHAETVRGDATWTSGAFEARFGLTALHKDSGFLFDGVTDRHHVAATTLETGLSTRGKYTADAWTLGWDGARGHRRDTRIERIDSGGGSDETDNASVNRAALFGQYEWTLPHAWTLSAGARWEAGALNPLLHAVEKIDEQRQWRFAFTRTYKAPTLAQLSARRYTVDNNNSAINPDNQGNPDVRAERAWGLDAAYEQYFGKDSLASASAYVRRIDDLIVDQLYQQGGSWIVRPANGGRELVKGLELEARGALLRASLSRNWSHMEGQAPWNAALGLDLGKHFGASFNLEKGASWRSASGVFSANGMRRELDMFGVLPLTATMRLRVALANVLHQDAVSRLSYADSVRRSAIASPATLRVTLEIR
ncbi:MAG: TonB-dependent receptor [Pseudomonadota bacterium]